MIGKQSASEYVRVPMSNCCGAWILNQDKNGHGTCEKCLEYCAPGEPEEIEQDMTTTANSSAENEDNPK